MHSFNRFLSFLGFVFQSQEDPAATSTLTSANPLVIWLVCGLGFPERPMAGNLLVSHQSKADHDSDPVQVVWDYRAVRCWILPAKYSIEYTPSTTTIEFWIAELGIISNH
jgi:hypothetical protein